MGNTPTVGQSIRKVRKIVKMTQAELASASGISLMSIRRYESGEISPRMDAVGKIIKALFNTSDLDVKEKALDAWEADLDARELFKDATIGDTLDAMAADQEAGRKKVLEKHFDVLEYDGQVALIQCGASLEQLNPRGQKEAAKRVGELTKLSEYQADTSNKEA